MLPAQSAASSICKICLAPRSTWSWESSSTWEPSRQCQTPPSHLHSRQPKRHTRTLWIHFNEFICHISLLNTIPWIQNIEFPSIFRIEFKSWVHVNEIRFMNSDRIQWILISEFIYLWIHIRIQNLHIWIHTHEFIYSWIHIFISHMNSHVYEFI